MNSPLSPEHSAQLIDELSSHLETRADAISKAVYSVDASIYEISPLAIVLPRNREEVLAAMRIARKYKVPVIPRGAATGIAGGCIGRGLVIDTSKYLTKILEVNIQEEYVVCEPGVVQNTLNHCLAPYGYRLGPDTSTGNRATLGGMTANNSAGSRSLLYGRMVDHVLEVEMVLANGEAMTFGPADKGEIPLEIERLRRLYHADIERDFPKLPRRVSGYNLDELIKPGPLNLAKLIVGSEGTLGLITRIKVGICRVPAQTSLRLFFFDSMDKAFEAVEALLLSRPSALEMIDDKIVTAGRSLPLTQKRVGWIQGNPKATLIAEYNELPPPDVQCPEAYASQTIVEAHIIKDIWAVRESGLALLLSKRTYSRAIAFLEDVAVPPSQLASFMRQFLSLLARYGKEAGVYGHVGAGCMHVRPYIDLRDPSDLKQMRAIMEEAVTLLRHYGGTLSGEHGDGIVRSWLNEKMFGPHLFQAFIDVKRVFDPEGRMNPGKIVPNQGLLENLRMDPSVVPLQIETQFDFSREGGFHLAADLCNGNGLCRKREGLMCPSFQAYGDEFHSTRARAQSFRAVLNGRLPPEAFTDHGLYNVLEYCLECKGCKTQCPSQVDMAKMKAEFLYHYQEKHGYTLRSRLFAYIGRLQQWGLTGLFPEWGLAKKWLGIAPQRTLPKTAQQRFSRWLASETRPERRKKVVLFNDTFTEFNHPEIGQAAVKVLDALGYEAIVPSWRCCGRPLISKGFLKQAKTYAHRLLKELNPYVKMGYQIIGLEPSCLYTILDDYPDLIASAKLTGACRTMDQFLAERLSVGEWTLQLSEEAVEVYLHGHCYQKALEGMLSTRQVLAYMPGVKITEIDSGCCGMAGSFGYEAEHYEFSLQIAEQKLFPALRQMPPGAVVIANGMSCRSQILQGTDHRPKHLVQFLADRLI